MSTGVDPAGGCDARPPVDPDGLDALADRLRAAKLTDIYVHVGPLNGNGTLPLSRAPYAEEFAAALHERLGGLRVQAGLGQVEAGGGGPLDLSREGVRAQVVASARRFMDLGYDGVHYDIEPIWTGDEDFLSRARGSTVPSRMGAVRRMDHRRGRMGRRERGRRMRRTLPMHAWRAAPGQG